VDFGRALPRIREAVERDLRRPGIPREKVLAAVVRLLEETSIRVGNEEYRRQNESFGLTTLQDDHVSFEGTRLRFEFRAKGGKTQQVELSDSRLARVVKQCQDVPGQELFQYLDEDGERHAISSEEVNAYLREVSGGDFTAKDFRTWNGTVLAARYLRLAEPGSSPTVAKKQVVEVIKQVSESLRNTPAVCRKSYVHPGVVDAYLSGTLISIAAPGQAPSQSAHALSEEERCVLAVLDALGKAA
jgi:DNA topoisomerase-1